MNTVCLMGRLTRDPELRHTQVGTAVVSFTLAVDRGKGKSDGERITDFIDCVAWKGTAEIISKYFARGQMAAVEGRIQVRDWTDKDGNKRKSTEVVVSKIFFADSKKSREGASQSTEYTSQEFEEFAADDEYDDDLPF